MSTQSGTILGAWTPFSTDITSEASQAFKTAFKDFVGVKYTPVAVATQIVAGTNYRFFCNITLSVEFPNEAAIVDIYQPLGGNAHITAIKKV